MRGHKHGIYYDDFDVADDPCIAVCRTVLAFDLPELTQCAHPNPVDYTTNWVIDDTVALNLNSEDKHYHLSLHLAADRTRVASQKTPFDTDSGMIVHFTYKNVTSGRHYICIGSCADRDNYIYTIDTNAHAIYSYLLDSSIGSHLLTGFDCPVFGDGTIFIGGFRCPRSYYHNESVTYAVNPTMVMDALKLAPIPDELIHLALKYI
jgi:hypothetical protein